MTTLDRRHFVSVLGAGPLADAAYAGASGSSVQPQRRRSRRAQEVVRVGIIGAGANVQDVHIPGLRGVPGCEILAVANRSLSSSRAVTERFGIPRPYAHWGELLDDEDIDAVLIGTWPYMHRTLTLEALARGKHVLCQARMANNAREAHDMLEASRREPDLVCQLVPTSTSYVIDNVLKRLIGEGAVGEVLSVEIQRVGRAFPDFQGELDWRHDIEFSGYNALNVGSTYESMMRWLGRGSRVVAMAKTHVPYRRNAAGQPASVGIPDHFDILYELANGAQVHMRMSETCGLSSGNQTWIHGSEGTIHVDASQSISAGRRGDSRLSPVANPPGSQARYRVEEEFVNAIRGEEEVSQLTFEAGAHYMEFTEAVHLSARSGQAVHLPLAM
ncbi:MAG: Gfo/Idh/MocA family oxidoreductase [Gemmatimonadetes bacterium]|nr:Gfo/Idh/MocA family oxidoreductase [Gemmatimonadota bacterium]